MKTFPQPLTAREEREYLERYKEGDQEARAILIQRNMRLVAHVIKKYQGTDYDMEDLLSVGTIGLIKAVNTFRMDKGSRLATYAAKCVENAMQTEWPAARRLRFFQGGKAADHGAGMDFGGEAGKFPSFFFAFGKDKDNLHTKYLGESHLYVCEAPCPICRHLLLFFWMRPYKMGRKGQKEAVS